MDMIRQDVSDFSIPAEQAGFRGLFAEVVLMAIRDCLRIGTVSDLDHRRAISWVNSPSTRPGSMIWYCQWIGVEPECVRARVNKSGEALKTAMLSFPEYRKPRMAQARKSARAAA